MSKTGQIIIANAHQRTPRITKKGLNETKLEIIFYETSSSQFFISKYLNRYLITKSNM
ncbi:hypothetical protein SAMN06265367_108202 [Algoriphagus winogradskyi]|uniref:Uncharacterized protein n=1 Tax=Algoriphagus winogradskyi TaxID=237017 RepID=A0ABY1PFW3_9BACT|nr:hypothetical protein SAMN06265367_108202 [Algoriphagus winogradskyi]